MNDNIVQVASRYLGKHETYGKNDGPEIRKWKAMLGAGVVAAPRIPWCGIYLAAMLMIRNDMNRRQLVAALRFRPGSTFFESTDSWVAEFRAAGYELFLDDPRPGDLFFRMKRLPDGSFSRSDADHCGIVSGRIQAGSFRTIEGNTTPGTTEGASSREGDGAYSRSRIYVRGRYLFARLLSKLTGFAS